MHYLDGGRVWGCSDGGGCIQMNLMWFRGPRGAVSESLGIWHMASSGTVSLGVPCIRKYSKISDKIVNISKCPKNNFSLQLFVFNKDITNLGRQ